MLAYATSLDDRRRGGGGLWIAPITFRSRAERLIPRVEASAARLVTRTCLAAPAGFSPDGRWIYAAVRDELSSEVRVKRFAITADDSGRSLTARPPDVPPSG